MARLAKKTGPIFLFLIGLILGLSACDNAAPTPDQANVVATAVAATIDAQPTPTPFPTSTSTPTPTLEDLPTVTPQPPTNTPQPTATDTPTPPATGTVDATTPTIKPTTAAPTTKAATVNPTSSITPTATPRPPGNGLGSLVIGADDGSIEVVDLSGGMRKLADGASPVWSPDGKTVAFALTQIKPGDLGHTTTIYTVPVSGGTPTPTCIGSFGVNQSYLLRWSPHGRYIVMYSNADTTLPSGETNLCDLNSNKFNADMQTTQGAVSLLYDWTPDGNNALWLAAKDNNWNIFYGDPDKHGSDAVALTDGKYQLSEGDNFYSSARFSPDGKTIAIAGKGIFLMSAPGQQSAYDGRILDTPDGTKVAWLPNGTALAYFDPAAKTVSLFDLTNGQTQLVASNVDSFDWTRQ